MAQFIIQKQKTDAYAYLVRVGKYFIYAKDKSSDSQKEVPNEYKGSVAEMLLGD